MRVAWVVAGLIVAGAALAVWLARPLARRRGTRPDPAWKASGTVQKFTGYDQRKAVDAKARAFEHEQARRRIAATVPDAPAPKKLHRIDRRQAVD